MLVRAAEPRDAAAIAAVHVRAWQAAYRGLLPDPVLDGLSAGVRGRAWRERLETDGSAGFTLVAEEGGAVAGFCAVATPSRDDDAGEATAELTALYVDPPHWRRGAGRSLSGEAAGRLRDGGWAELTAWAFAGNAAALAAYAAYGFEADGATRREPVASLSRAASPRQIRLRARLAG